MSAEVAIQLAYQGISVFLGLLGQMRDETFDLLAARFAQRLHAAKISRVRLNQTRIELVLPD
jgi:hypothetical protein